MVKGNGCAATAFSILLGILCANLAYAANCTAVMNEKNFQVMTVLAYNKTIHEIQDEYGMVNIYNLRENGEDSICYFTNETNGKGVVIFSAGALGGWDFVHLISAYKNATDYPHMAKCSRPAKNIGRFVTKSGISFNSTKMDLKSMLGTPSKSSNSYYMYKCGFEFDGCNRTSFRSYKRYHKDAICKHRHGDRTCSIIVFFKFNKAERIELYVTESF